MNNFLEITIPDEQNLYIVGDLHGNADLYDITLKEMNITKNDVVVSVGDIIDRGNNSTRLLFEFLFSPNRFMVLGNHETMMLNSSNSSWKSLWMNCGGDKVLNELGSTGIDFFKQYINNLPYIMQINHRGKKIGIVHGAVPLEYTDWSTFVSDIDNLDNDLIDDILWNTKTFDFCKKNVTQNSPKINGIDYVFSGHTAVVNPLIYGNRVWIDSMFLSGDITVSSVNGNMLRMVRRPNDEYSFKR